MARLGALEDIDDRASYDRAVARFRDRRIVLPTFSELADPASMPDHVRNVLHGVDPDDAHPLNLFRVHWYNGADRASTTTVPAHLVLPEALTGTPARIVVALADRFPMIRAHKVLASYGCLAPRIVTGHFDPTHHRAVWPSTGNYCRGGVAISRLMGCRGVAVLPEGMSAERFEWLESWVEDPSDVVRTPGTESNVKEIYDECNRLAGDDTNVVLNQFSEIGNHLVHYHVTGRALDAVAVAVGAHPGGPLTLRAFVSATGSAGTIAAGEYLKERHGSQIVAVEALECPTMLYNGFGEHNIQGIGDKHIPLIHNVMETDVVTAISDRATDRLNVAFNTDAGRRYLVERRGVDPDLVASLSSLGLSSICNVLAAIKLAKHRGLTESDAVITVATDGAAMYRSERDRILAADFAGGFDELAAAEVFGEDLSGVATDHLRELDTPERERIFNLGYFTWVEQQGVPVGEFVQRKSQSFWQQVHAAVPALDERIREFNERTGVATG